MNGITKPVIFKEDAYCLFSTYLQKHQLPDEVFSVTLMRKDKAYYWIICYKEQYYRIRVALESEVEETENGTIGYSKVLWPMDEVCIKENIPEMKEQTSLWIKFSFDWQEQNLLVDSVVLKGKAIENFPHTYWKSDSIIAGGGSCNRCTGTTYFMYRGLDGTLSLYPDKQHFKKVALWEGSKCIHEYSSSHRPALVDILAFWKNFLHCYVY